MRIKELFESSYRGQHTAPRPEDNSPLHDLTDIYGDDIYSPNALRYYGTGDSVSDRESLSVIMKARGNPNMMVTIYRAVPKNVSEINSGGWVTLSKNYAKKHGASWVRDGVIISKKVAARTLFTNGDSMNEFGYWGR